MRTCIGVLSVLALTLVNPGKAASAADFSTAVFDEVKPSVVRVSCNDRTATGFLWSSSDLAVTALHVVADCGNVTVYFESQRVSRPASVVRVLRRADLALLKIDNAPGSHPLQSDSSPPSLSEPLSTLGYPLQIPSMTNTSLQLRYGGKTLRDIVPESVAQSLSGGSPSLDLEIDGIEGHLLPGDSGAPVFNVQRKVVAIADGGLQNGAVAISWAVPAKFLNQLVASSENASATSTGPRSGALFAADADVKNLGQATCSGVALTKIRSTSFALVSASADDPRGLMQLVQYFGVDPAGFSFDVYQHLKSGATLVVPAGTNLRTGADGDCTAADASGRIAMRLRVGFASSLDVAQAESSAFESSLDNGNNMGWFADPQWSYKAPVTRFDGTVIRRRGYSHMTPAPTPFQDKYVFEALAVRNNVFIGAATMYTVSPAFSLRARQCRMAMNQPGCQDARDYWIAWVKTVLAIQLTTFPVG